ncbi:MAG: A/G-specific adenine glycosylase [Candidatus Nanopelagicales bacterium]
MDQTPGTYEVDAISGEMVTQPVRTWFEANARELPWREPDTTAWGVLISEVMSQQTPVARVAPAWQRWMAQWPTPADLAASSPADVIRAWDRLGYPRRALWLREAAIKICEEFDSQVPSRYEELRTLPGVGDYTAAAVVAFAFRQRVVVLDTNVRRVIARAVSGIEAPESASPTVAERRLGEALLPLDPAEAAQWSVACMELGALVCTSRSPECGRCVLQATCAWVAAGRPAAVSRSRPTQRFTGTDRQVRGKLMAVLRAADGPVTTHALASAWPDESQRSRCLDTLVADGLVEPLAGRRYRLPT